MLLKNYCHDNVYNVQHMYILIATVLSPFSLWFPLGRHSPVKEKIKKLQSSQRNDHKLYIYL